MPRPYFCRLLKWFFSFLCILFQSGESKHTIHDQAEILKSNHVHATLLLVLIEHSTWKLSSYFSYWKQHLQQIYS
jgi:hypothetical protein